MKMRMVIVAGLLPAALGVACGGGGHADHTAAPSSRTVDIDMEDIAFRPPAVTAHRGESVRFVFHNRGKIAHDAFIGNAAAQAAHEREMRSSDTGMQGGGMQGGGMQGGGMNHDGMHGDAGITVQPGQTGSLTYTFDQTGPMEVACHQPGHYAAGMKVAVTVA
jgi:uncharacterized cupredoxin-like copper-binding protein